MKEAPHGAAKPSHLRLVEHLEESTHQEAKIKGKEAGRVFTSFLALVVPTAALHAALKMGPTALTFTSKFEHDDLSRLPRQEDKGGVELRIATRTTESRCQERRA